MSRQYKEGISLLGEERTLYFVYGTLKKGYSNNRILRDSEFIGKGRTVDKTALYNFGCPALFFTEDGLPTLGEVYAVTEDFTRVSLDLLEGYPYGYDRKQVDVLLDSGGTVRAWVYFVEEDPGREVSTDIEDNANIWRRTRW